MGKVKTLDAFRCFIGLALGVIWLPATDASEIVLLANSRPKGSIVRLGDVAEVRGIDSSEVRRLQSLPLMPAPAPGTYQFLRLQQVRELLEARGEDVMAHHFNGATQVRIGTDVPVPNLARRTLPKKITTSIRIQVREEVHKAIVDHLHENASPNEPWQVAFELTDAQLRQLADATTPIAVIGGQSPWNGLQNLTIRSTTPAGLISIPLVANVSLPEPIVVAIHTIPRGAVVRADDVALRRVAGNSNRLDSKSNTHGGRPFMRLDQVLGAETKRAIPAGDVLTQQAVQQPVVVKRGDTVTITARASGVTVRSYARARESGSRGDLIVVESLEGRESIAARVVGLRQVEVFAHGVDASAYGIDSPAGMDRIPIQKNQTPRPGPVLDDELVAKQPVAGILR
ncbi:MAG: flagellar basal body P-ring formation protein FlgA [Pirellulales bacterium]|nr:flagellar basal body P-ring formation protein FlgA [Pirellulales bacterium]